MSLRWVSGTVKVHSWLCICIIHMGRVGVEVGRGGLEIVLVLTSSQVRVGSIHKG